MPDVIFREAWAVEVSRVRKGSPWGHLRGWELVPVIVKSEDDLRQEQLAAQVCASIGFYLFPLIVYILSFTIPGA